MKVCSCLQLITVESLALSMLQQREQKEMKSFRKVTKIAREANEGLPVYQQNKSKHAKITNSTTTDVTYTGAWCNRIVANQ